MSDITVPDLGESIQEGTLHRWYVKEGDRVNDGDVLAELETDKVNLEISAERDGIVAAILRNEGEVVHVGEVIGTLNEGSAKDAVDQVEVEGDAVGRVYATPAARKLAREQGIDLDEVRALDVIGRVHVEDVRRGGKSVSTGQSVIDDTKKLSHRTAKVSNGEDSIPSSEERIRMSRRRQTIAKRLVEAQQTAAMLTTFNEVDMTAIIEIRKRRKVSFKEKHEVGLGFMSFFTKAVVGALKAYPMMNAELDGEDIIVKKHYDIGIAVAAEEGLVVPVVRDADQLSFAEIEKRIATLAEQARSNKLQLSDLRGGTFTITNGGVFGSLLSTPILNTPQVGILGMHTIQLRPVAIDEVSMENRPMMYIALSYDHRLIDGSEAVGFLRMVKQLLEDPEELLLEG